MQSGYCPLRAEPNRLCDLIAAGITDEYLKRDPESRVRVSVTGGHGALFVAGELATNADFDVAAVVRRILGKYGIPDGLEPFISLEKTPSERLMHARQNCIDPVMGFGYAVAENEAFIPEAQYIANKIALALEEKRKQDPDWFWMSRIGAVSTIDTRNGTKIFIRLDHGEQDLGTVRREITTLVETLELKDCKLTINSLGAFEYHGLKTAIGQSGMYIQPYGGFLPQLPNPAGLDWHNAKVAANIVARHAALKVQQKSNAKAVMVRLAYAPGDDLPMHVWLHDEKGRDLKEIIDLENLHLQKCMDGWKQNDLMSQIALYGLAGNPNLPWESAR